MHHFHNRQQHPHDGHVATPQLRQSLTWGGGHEALIFNLPGPEEISQISLTGKTNRVR